MRKVTGLAAMTLITLIACGGFRAVTTYGNVNDGSPPDIGISQNLQEEKSTKIPKIPKYLMVCGIKNVDYKRTYDPWQEDYEWRIGLPKDRPLSEKILSCLRHKNNIAAEQYLYNLTLQREIKTEVLVMVRLVRLSILVKNDANGKCGVVFSDQKPMPEICSEISREFKFLHYDNELCRSSDRTGFCDKETGELMKKASNISIIFDQYRRGRSK
ncbi:hypothetical protein [Parasphingorhabdus cellanae]|uniref:Lipoprotein n=1 Tax=Parasphingorhabdus cellanae TaxID=2806553 RepID=A0ABX7T7A7_9SPHN|nr:hypothetical protein [Parasphingorhabdus cellanae]QTD57490.1 hypothetical protein J4G78_08195 [Parasphingorhabdus cellanae]